MVPPHKRSIGMVFQGLALWPHKTVERHLSFVLGETKITKAEKRDRIDAVLEKVQAKKVGK